MGSTPADLMFSFLERMRSPLTVPQLKEEFQGAIEAFGFSAFGIAYLPNPGERMRDLRMLYTWNEAWADRYFERGYAFADPILQRVRVSDDPFLWSEAIEGQPVRQRSMLIMSEATAFRMNAGFTIPIRTARGFEAVVTMSGEQADLSPDDRGALHLIGLYAHAKLIAIAGGPEGTRTRPKLTVRERDCLSWCSEGKSSWEISVILGIGKKTVDEYIATAGQKLGCTNRQHAVAEALRLKLIA